MEPSLQYYDEQGSRQRQRVAAVAKKLVNVNARVEMCTDDHSYYNAYKKLITDVAETLLPGDCERLAYQQDISGIRSPLDLLKQLENKGKIGYSKIHELSLMLESINRSDVISSKIEPFERKCKL